MKTWARWTLLILYVGLLMLSAAYWNPFASLPALLKFSVITVLSAALFGLLVILMQFYILLSIIFPLPPRADAKAPKSIFKKAFKFLYKPSPINPKAPQYLDEMIGNEMAKIEIKEAIDILKKAKNYEESGAQVPKGMLFVGPPGVGKTLFARAIANEVGMPFYVIEGGAISGLIMGLGVLKLKTLFRKLQRHDTAILFIDEIESMGAKRQQDRGFGGQADMNMTLNTLLTEMDGFHGSRLIVIGATNNDGMLDPALMRAGRMDRRIYFQMPTIEERANLFRFYLGKVLTDANDLDIDRLTGLTANYSPAEIAGVVNEAALISRRPGNPGKVNTEMVLQALDRVSVGLERSITNSNVSLINHDPTIRFDAVLGMDEVKKEVTEIVDFLKQGEALRKIGAKIPKGVLMIGPPGVGKSMLAKAIANEAGVPFYGFSASLLKGPNGEGAATIRSIYTQARKNPASIVFIDEIDSIGASQSINGTIRSDELNQLLVELDGIGRSNVVTIGATNLEDHLDTAFFRSGRFDRKVYVGLPDRDSRALIFEKYLKALKLHGTPDLEKLARLSVNFSGADIAAACNEAAIISVRENHETVSEDELEEAITKISVTAGQKLNTEGMNLGRIADLDVKLSDVKGMDESMAEAAEVVALLKNMDLLLSLDLKAPKGILLVGKPGTGKTMLAKAIANEAGVAFYPLSGGDFNSRWAGVGADRVRRAYEQARRSGKPAIVFIDEIDALGGKRGEDMGGGAIQDSNKTLNQFLVELDGFGKHKVLTIGATNNAELLDPALVRPGRFDRIIEIPLPNLEGRREILAKYLGKYKLHPDVNLTEIARMTVFDSGADLANIANEAGLFAIREGRTEIQSEDVFRAIQRVSFGISRSQKILLEELWATAYHEAGHTIVSYLRNKREYVQVVTIVPTGRALGYMWRIKKDDPFHHSPTKQELLTRIEIALGGYAAEMAYMDTTTAGVSGDLQNVAQVANAMVREFGMGSFPFCTDIAFGANGFNSPERYGKPSQETEQQIDRDIKKIVDECLETTRNLIKSKRAELDAIAKALVEKETLYYRDLVAILEPHRTKEDVDREISEMSERKLVGKPAVIDLNMISGLKGIAAGTKKKSARDTNGNGKNGHGAAVDADGNEVKVIKDDDKKDEESKN